MVMQKKKNVKFGTAYFMIVSLNDRSTGSCTPVVKRALRVEQFLTGEPWTRLASGPCRINVSGHFYGPFFLVL